MHTWKNLLVGLDLHHGDRIASKELEAASQAALDQAVELATVCGASLTLVAVLELSEQAVHLIEADRQNLFNTVEDVAATDLQQLAEKLRGQGLKVTTRVVIGKGWEELTKEAIRGRHDLVIVGTRKRSSTTRMLFGSTSNKLLRTCPVPVWVVKPGEVRELREVLIATDFSEVGLQVSAAGVAVAKLLNAKLFVAHALEFPFETYLHTAGVSEAEIAGYRKRLHQEAHDNVLQQLSQCDYRTVQQGVKVEILEGSPDSVIPKLIDDDEIDLLVIGTHGRSGFSGMLLGNTVERLIPHVHSSLLVIKPADFVSPVKV